MLKALVFLLIFCLPCGVQADPPHDPSTVSEQRAAYLCRLRVREVANEMRQTVERLVRETVPGIFEKIKVLRHLYPYIDALERVALDCCQGGSCTECCLKPLLDELETWKKEGVPH